MRKIWSICTLGLLWRMELERGRPKTKKKKQQQKKYQLGAYDMTVMVFVVKKKKSLTNPLRKYQASE